jgi:phosphatidylserine/phosphatidylglycerophosphate/cardiolipin synthase-like enzyme
MVFRCGALAAILTLGLACGSQSDDAGGGGPGGGKADNPYGISACEADEMRAWLQRCSTDDAAMAAEPYKLRSNQREALLAHRDGADGECGTGDDGAFADLDAVDAISGIGPATITGLGQDFAAVCSSGGELLAEAFFSPKKAYAETHVKRVVELIDSARHSLDIAVYSYGDYGDDDQRVSDALTRALEKGVAVRFIFQEAQKERSCSGDTSSSSCARTDPAKVEKLGIDVRYVTKSKVMHHKFVIVDGPVCLEGEDCADDPEFWRERAGSATLATGSGNWTSSASTIYDENMVVLSGVAPLILAFQHEFNTLWNQSEDFEWGEFELQRSVELDPATFPESESTAALFTSANFDASRSSFPRVRPRYTVAEALADEIGKAERSIYVASGHLRSRRIVEALFERKRQLPDLDVRVYLDGQEYVSSNWREDRDREECLAEAGDSESKKADCLDSSYHYSYKVAHEDLDGDGDGGDIALRMKYYAYRWHYSFAPQMHHKYFVIDGETLITGSYNLSHNAEVGSFENVVVLRAASEPGFQPLVDAFEDNFLEIWATDEDRSAYEALLDRIHNAPTDEVPLVFKPSMALTQTEIAALKRAVADYCPAANPANRDTAEGQAYWSADPPPRTCPSSGE